MKRNIITILLVGIWLSVVGQVVAFQSDYISVKVEGSGPDLILIHGFTCSPEVWSGLAKDFYKKVKGVLVQISSFQRTNEHAEPSSPENESKSIGPETKSEK